MCQSHQFRPLMPAAFLVLILFASGVAGFGEPSDEGEDSKPNFAKLKPGMTPEQVRDTVGAPKHIARQIFYHRYREQWTYDGATPIRLTFDCPRGQMPQLLPLSRFPIETDASKGRSGNR